MRQKRGGRPKGDLKKQQASYDAGGLGTKRCTKCGKVKDKQEFYRYSFALRSRGDSEGFRARCKDCVREDAAEYKKENRKRVNAYMRQVRAAARAAKAAAKAARALAEQHKAAGASVRGYRDKQ